MAIKYDHLDSTSSASGWRNFKPFKIFRGNTLCFVFLQTLSIIPEQQQSGNSDCLSAVIYIYLRSHKTYNENIYCYADLLQLSKQNV